MAEVDDADDFGDFKFVTAVDPNPKINGRDSTVSDDDWGDFVTDSSSQIKAQVVLSNEITYSQSPPAQIPFDPFGSFNVSNGSAPTRPETEPIRVETEPAKVDKTRWVKPQGAFPLSLFGEEQEEEESRVGESRVGDVANDGFAKKESNLNVKNVGIDDLIANLYCQNPNIVFRNGSDLNFGSGGPNSPIKGLNFIANGMDLKFDDPIPNGNGKFGGFNLGANGFDLKFDGVGSNSKTGVSNSGFGGPTWVKNGLNFSAKALDLKHDALVPKEKLGGLNLDSNLKFDGVDSNSNKNELKLNWEEENEDFDEEDDDGWEFKTADLKEKGVVEVAGSKPESSAHVRPGIQVEEKWQANTGGSRFSGGFLFDFNPKPVTRDNFFFDPLSISKQNNAADKPNSTLVNGNLWEFKDAFSETGPEHKLEEAKAASPASVGAHARNDFFAAFNGDSSKSGASNFAFPYIPTSGTKGGVISDSHSSGKKEDNVKELSSSPDAGSDDDFWEFKDAFSGSGSKFEGESVVAGNSPISINPSAMGVEIQHNEVTLENHRRALPLSIFGDEELETDDSSIQFQQNISTHTTASHQVNTNKSPASNLSITDLISSLYSQVDQNTNTIHAPKLTENTAHTAPTILESDFGDDFDEDSWEFKDAVSRDQNQTSIATLEDSPQDSSTKVHLDNYVDLYCKLKDETYGLALYHLENKKKAQSGATLSGEDTTVDTLEDLEQEIQKLYSELHQHNMISDQFQSGNLSSRNTQLHEVRKLLQDPKVQVFESEYKLSQRLSLAENDLRSAVELSRHAASTLRILRLGSTEEQSNYISTWSRIVSVCAEELKHGSLIWRQSLEANVQTQILSKPQGKQYILSLGEIYRVVLVLEASAKLYESWILLHSSDCSSFFSLLNKCSTLWSSSGLDEALKSISDAIDFKYDGTIAELLDSMTYIHHLDAFALQNQVVVNDQEPICSLSLLTAGALPGVKMVTWNGENYLLKLANLWANLISPSPPQLPHVRYS
ncbi:uncharacterized protein [Pyrus communis]|uniref:uncharacterized protein isoform X1 n=1 Tax=Pyrus communis TaxID=23211 RepID=UPI0035C1C919